jgi:hypothetical protein
MPRGGRREGAGRKVGYVNPESTRRKIKATLLVMRLQDHAFGVVELSMSQVRAIGILLKKIIPDLTSTEVKSEVTHHYVAEIPPVLSKQEWLEKYGAKPTLQ